MIAVNSLLAEGTGDFLRYPLNLRERDTQGALLLTCAWCSMNLGGLGNSGPVHDAQSRPWI